MLVALLVACPLTLVAGSTLPLPVVPSGEEEKSKEAPARIALAQPAPAPRLEVLEGRALVFGEHGFFDASRGPHGSAGVGGYLELGPAARIELAWSGLGSAQVQIGRAHV